MRLGGGTFAAIADQLGYASPTAARRAVQRAVREIGQEEARVLSTDAAHPKCLQALEVVLKIIDRADHLAGLVAAHGLESTHDFSWSMDFLVR
jgi:hypothetical protein